MAVYFYLGGLNNVAVSVENVGDYNMVGVKFSGKSNSDTLETAYLEARDYILNGELDGVLTMIHYKDSTLKKGHIKVFVGVKLNKGTSEIPSHYGRLTIPARKAVRATLEAHNIVMPNSETVEERINEKAKELNFDLLDFTIEQYVNEEIILIDIPVRQ
jgi:hypothetical protein